MISIRKNFSFEASHKLPYHKGACAELHGHSYKLEVEVTYRGLIKGRADHLKGMVTDFGDLTKVVNEMVIETHDHKHLNTIYENPTAETMVERIAHDIQKGLRNRDPGVVVIKVVLWETEKCRAIWSAP